MPPLKLQACIQDMSNQLLKMLIVRPQMFKSMQERELEASGFTYVGQRDEKDWECCGECESCDGPPSKPAYRANVNGGS